MTAVLRYHCPGWTAQCCPVLPGALGCPPRAPWCRRTVGNTWDVPRLAQDQLASA
ncbi:hypothetical protein L873DRAFT_1814130, partial [Choiromyces venosus 120613-1]